MEVLWVSAAVIVTVLSTWVKVVEDRDPTCSMLTEFTITHPSRPDGLETCRPCPKCPPGQGLLKQCGSKVPNGTSTNCVSCEANRTYSTSHDSSTCRACNDCGLKNVQQVCTPFQNRECGTSCPEGYFFDEFTDDCKMCYFCCDHVPEHDRVEKCKALNMPSHMRCEWTLENENCKKLYEKAATTIKSPVETAPFDMTLTTTKEPSTTTSGHSSNSWSQPMTTSKNLSILTEDTYLRVKNDASTPPSTKEKDYKAGMITLFVGLAIFIIVLIMCFTRRKKTTRNNAEQMRSLLQPNPSLHENTAKLNFIPQEQDLKNLPYEVEKLIKRLDCRSRGLSNWHDIGRKFNVPVEDLEQLELEYQRTAGSPMKGLLDILHTKHSTNLQGLVMVLLELERKDIADGICSFYVRTQGSAIIKSESNSSVESAESYV